jgi:hypothetical protein
MMKEKMKEFERALDGESINLESGEDAEFVIKKSWLSKTDPCFCGSGRKVVDCCIPNERFNEIAIKELRKQIKSEIIASYCKADHVRFSSPNDKELPAIIFAYRIKNLDSKGHHGLIRSYKNEELKLIGSLKENMITLSFVEVETEEIITLKPLPCNPRQLENFLKNKFNRISILLGLVHPKNEKDIIIPIPNDGAPPSQIIIKGIEIK